MKHNTKLIIGSFGAIGLVGAALLYHHHITTQAGTNPLNKLKSIPSGAQNPHDQIQTMINRILSSGDWAAARAGWKTDNLSSQVILRDKIFGSAIKYTPAGQNGQVTDDYTAYNYPGAESLFGSGNTAPVTNNTTPQKGNAGNDYVKYVSDAAAAAAAGGLNPLADIKALGDLAKTGGDVLSFLGI